MFEEIKSTLPNFPDEVITDWLLPFANELGWPPTHERWPYIFAQPIGSWYATPTDFWRNTSWTKEVMDFSAIALTPSSRKCINDMLNAYLNNEDNSYRRTLGPRGKARYMNVMKYLLEQGHLPKPPVLLQEAHGHSIIDGNHRFLAWESTATVHRQYAIAPEDMKQSFMRSLSNKWGISSMTGLSNTQEVWVAKENS